MKLDDNFKEKLEMGISAENIVYEYLVANNSYVEDLRQQKHGEFAGPRLVGTEGKVVLPDFIVYNKKPEKGCFAVDVKAKNSIYTIRGKKCFTVDTKYEDYLKASRIKRLDFLALIFVFEGRMYMYRDSDVLPPHQFRPNQHGDGLVYPFEFSKDRMIY